MSSFFFIHENVHSTSLYYRNFMSVTSLPVIDAVKCISYVAGDAGYFIS